VRSNSPIELPATQPSSGQRLAPCSRLLVAEDDRDLRDLLVAGLRADGYDIVEVATGLELLDALMKSALATNGHAFDLVISDVRMPGLSGVDALAKLGHGTRAAPVLFITAFGDDEVHEQARQAGAIDVLDKPIDIDDLRAFVAAFLAGRER